MDDVRTIHVHNTCMYIDSERSTCLCGAREASPMFGVVGGGGGGGGGGQGGGG